jgi:hypothetical protein
MKVNEYIVLYNEFKRNHSLLDRGRGSNANCAKVTDVHM